MKISYNWLKWYVPELPEVDKLPDLFTFHLCEVEGIEKLPDGDTILDINILPNRAHDLLSHQGIARELSGQLGIPFVDPTPKYKIPTSQPTKLEIDAAQARRYMGRVVRNVKIGPSPDWVVKHLESIGQRSINNIVDATNITMYDCGQPCHAFDLDKVLGKISVRPARDGEQMTTLDNKEVVLNENDFVIADDEAALALAGVKGGKKAEVDVQTTNIILEVANFFPVRVRKTARRLGIFTDSAKRFENDLSPELCDFAMTELSALIAEMCPDAVFEDVVDQYPVDTFKQKRTLAFSADSISKSLGLVVTDEQIIDILNRYHIPHTESNGSFEITVPQLRLDLQIPEDMAEEIGRVLGYDKVVPKISTIDFKPRVNEMVYKMLAVRKKLFNDGYGEAITYSFGQKGSVRVMHSAEGKNFLRENLKDGLAEALARNTLNAPLLRLDQIKIFEIGTVFSKDGEEMRVAYNEKKQIIEMTLDEFCAKNGIVASDSYGDLLGTRSQKLDAKFIPWSLYPFITRDIAVWVPDGVQSSEVYAAIKEHAGELLSREPRLVDTFAKDGRTSYAFRLVFQSFEKTLTDAEVEPYTTAIYGALQEKGFEIR